MKRSKFNLSYYNLLSCDMGQLVPIGLTEVIPGDTFQHSTSLLVRVSPLLAPVMHPVHVRIHHWFVPHRLVWEDWEDFITGGPDGFDASAFPYMIPDASNNQVGELFDYLGVPPGLVTPFTVSALPARGYTLIFNEWYRDQDLVSEAPISIASGIDGTTQRTLQNIAWEKDYFTSARPWTQKGPEVTIPLSGDAPITGLGVAQNSTSSGAGRQPIESDGSTPTYPFSNFADEASTVVIERASGALGARPNVFADLSGVSAANINELRTAFALQRYEEARARYGSRYTEYLRYLGVRSSDARLQRPEYLGGGKQVIQFSEVLQTAPDSSATPNLGVGDLKGHGIGAVRSNRYRRFFEEHGYVFTMLSVRPKTIYTQGLARTWNRRTKEDFWQRELQHIGQQEILNKELYAAGASPDAIFGYQDRYDEYRRSESRVSGEFRTTALDYWHMARIFSSAPALNGSFVTSIPTKRINAVQSEDVLWIMANHHLKARRQVAATGSSYIF